jgi:hypothetical protein
MVLVTQELIEGDRLKSRPVHVLFQVRQVLPQNSTQSTSSLHTQPCPTVYSHSTQVKKNSNLATKMYADDRNVSSQSGILYTTVERLKLRNRLLENSVPEIQH